MAKYFKIVYGYNEGDYLPITADELHKAFVVAMKGGSANFEAGFYRDRGKDTMRITEDWHRIMGWNRGYKMVEEDYAEIRPLKEKYKETRRKGQLLAEYIIRENKTELLSIPASEAYKKMQLLLENNNKYLK